MSSLCFVDKYMQSCVLAYLLPSGDNKTIGDDKCSGLEFFFEFLGEFIHIPWQEIDKDDIGISIALVPEIPPDCLSSSRVFAKCIPKIGVQNKPRIDFKANGANPFLGG